MDIRCYTKDEFIEATKLKCPPKTLTDFLTRISNNEFPIRWVVIWRTYTDIEDNQIDDWFKKTPFSGHAIKSYPCQIEFEKEEDVVAFILTWS